MNLVNSGCRLLVEGSCFYNMQYVFGYIFLFFPIYTNFQLLHIFCNLGSNMPCTPDAADVLRKASVLIAPAMAAGAGGVRCLLYLPYLYSQKV